MILLYTALSGGRDARRLGVSSPKSKRPGDQHFDCACGSVQREGLFHFFLILMHFHFFIPGDHAAHGLERRRTGRGEINMGNDE